MVGHQSTEPTQSEEYEYDHVSGVVHGAVFSRDMGENWVRPSGAKHMVKAHVFTPSTHQVDIQPGTLLRPTYF